MCLSPPLGYDGFSVLFLITLIVLRSSSQVFCRMLLNWDLSGVFLMITQVYWVTGLKCLSHCPKSTCHMRLNHCWWLWFPCWSNVCQVSSCKVNLFGRESLCRPHWRGRELYFTSLRAEYWCNFIWTSAWKMDLFSPMYIYSMIYLYAYEFMNIYLYFGLQFNAAWFGCLLISTFALPALFLCFIMIFIKKCVSGHITPLLIILHCLPFALGMKSSNLEHDLQGSMIRPLSVSSASCHGSHSLFLPALVAISSQFLFFRSSSNVMSARNVAPHLCLSSHLFEKHLVIDLFGCVGS